MALYTCEIVHTAESAFYVLLDSFRTIWQHYSYFKSYVYVDMWLHLLIWVEVFAPLACLKVNKCGVLMFKNGTSFLSFFKFSLGSWIFRIIHKSLFKDKCCRWEHLINPTICNFFFFFMVCTSGMIALEKILFLICIWGQWTHYKIELDPHPIQHLLSSGHQQGD